MTNLIKRIHEVRSLGIAVVKTGKITGGINAAFASYADVWSSLQPHLLGAGLSVGWADGEVRGLADGEVVRMHMEVSDGQETSRHAFEMLVPEPIISGSGKRVVNNAQRTSNAMTYLKRLSLVAFFGIATGNEDDVERMSPQGDQINIPGAIRVDENTSWISLIEGVWRDVLAPAADGKLGDCCEADLREMWRAYPSHPGLMAWGADFIESKLCDCGKVWSDLVAIDQRIPGAICVCDATMLRKAAAAAIKLTA